MYIKVVLLDFMEMVLTLEQEQRLKKEKIRKIMSIRFDKNIMGELIDKWLCWFKDSTILKYKKRINETRWMTKSSSNGRT